MPYIRGMAYLIVVENGKKLETMGSNYTFVLTIDLPINKLR